MKEPTPAPKPKKRGSKRTRRTLQTFAVVATLTVLLMVWNWWVTTRDERLSTGPKGEAQREFFLDAVARPDIPSFFKDLEPRQRLQMSRNLGQYSDPKLVPLIVKLLADFDPEARAELTRSLAKIALDHPDAVANEMKVAGSFQRIGVFRALAARPDKGIPTVAAAMEKDDLRGPAAAFLFERGKASVPALLKLLDSNAASARVAAADALGKLKASSAAPKITALYRKAKGADREAYMAALSAIGHPSNEDLFLQVLSDHKETDAMRGLAAVGVGPRATPRTTKALWAAWNSGSPALRKSVIVGLQSSGRIALADRSRNPAARLEVASAVTGPQADAVISAGLRSPGLRMKAIEAAKGREALVPFVAALAMQTDATSRGKELMAMVEALGTTPAGERALAKLAKVPRLAGFVHRQKSISPS